MEIKKITHIATFEPITNFSQLEMLFFKDCNYSISPKILLFFYHRKATVFIQLDLNRPPLIESFNGIRYRKTTYVLCCSCSYI